MFVMDNAPDLSYLCKLLHETLQLPVYYKKEADVPEESFWSVGMPAHPSYSDSYDLFRAVILAGEDLLAPVVQETDRLEQFAVIPVKRNGRRAAVVILGPSSRQKPSEALYAKLLDDHGIPTWERNEWISYWRGLQNVDSLRLLHICLSANWMLNMEALDVMDVFQTSFQSDSFMRRKEKEREIADRREFSLFQETYGSVDQMLELIRKGKTTELMKQLAKATSGQAPVGAMSSRGHLRNVKNLAIGGITISSRAAAEGGLNEELASALCELHIRHIEEMNDLSKVEAAVIGAIVDFADRVALSRKTNVSKQVRDSMDYIYKHLFKEITFKQLAVVSGLNPHYLSKLFKKDTGFTLANYIQKERIEEAKQLLDHSNDPISSIGERLTFYDQAHFVKVFKKYAGVTPKQYRNRAR
ncbi:hypothetical protein BK126_04930 [Paenibacillus sp. FSL H7-0326]|nr:hypothetical protein BK126_04930 [Paenibacillus sp. FSL H7-0326]